MDCSPVYPEARLGSVDHHDGGGWLLHPLYRALPLPPEAGALPVPPDGGQLSAGPRGVFSGHLQQQDLSQRCVICCPRSLSRELALTLPSAPAFSLACLLNCTSNGCLKQCLCPAQTRGGACRGSSSFLSSQLSLSPEVKEGEGGKGTFLHKRKEKHCLSFSGGRLVGFFCLWKQWH